MNNTTLFYLLLLIRAVVPPFLFAKVHPFYAMILDEVGLDGFISPHHFFIDTIPDHIKGRHKLAYDIPLDTWGFFNGLQPVVLKSNPYYHVFEGYRPLILALFVYKLIGIALVYKLKDFRVFIFFPNFFIAVYLAVAYCRLFGEKDINKVIKFAILATYVRELYLVYINKKL